MTIFKFAATCSPGTRQFNGVEETIECCTTNNCNVPNSIMPTTTVTSCHIGSFYYGSDKIDEKNATEVNTCQSIYGGTSYSHCSVI